MKNIVIIGVGQLGSRHLQALRLIEDPIHIQVVDPSSDSLKIAEERFNQVNQDFKGEIQFISEISDLSQNIDVAIIATNSNIRRTVVEKLLTSKSVKYLVLEKVLFTKLEDYEIVGKLLKEKNVACWVNCPRRLYPVYKEIKENLQGKINLSIVANNFGLGCNGIHMVDLFAYLSGENEIQLTNELLDEELLSSKRIGYMEFSGTITGRTKKKDLFQLTSYPEGNSSATVTISNHHHRYIVKEDDDIEVGHATVGDKGPVWEIKHYRMPYQSQLTNIVVNDLLKSGNCGLTSFEDSVKLHLSFINNFIAVLQKKEINPITECLIT